MDGFYEALDALLGAPGWAWGVAGIALAFLLRSMLHGLLSRPRRRTSASWQRDADVSSRELQRSVARLESENAAFSNFFLLLPDFTKEINSRMERREVGPLLFKIIERLFEPSQILMFTVEKKIDEMVLQEYKGVGRDITRGFRVAIGEGRIGWVAQNRVAMDVDDFIREIRHAGGVKESSAHFQFKTELCAPMVHGPDLYGVISVGGVTKHYKYEKSMLTLVADLGSIALHNNKMFSQMREMANSDGLTRLYNKRFFMNHLSEEILKAEKGHHEVSLFMFDLDNFKNYNDQNGHQAGDEVLRITGQILRDTVRPDDIPARYGGEEFVVVLSHTDKEGAVKAAERIRHEVASHPYPHREKQPLKVVSLSGGVATFPKDGLSGADLIAAADAALYRAKEDGRNKVYRAKPDYFSDEADEADYKVNNG